MSSPSVAVLVFSCDAYSDAWSPFFHFFRKYWADCPWPVFLCSNQQDAPSEGVFTIKTLNTTNWTKSVALALDSLESDFVLWVQEDYFLTESVQTQALKDIVSIMVSENFDYFRLIPVPGPATAGELLSASWPYGIIGPDEPYRTSLQSAIWRVSSLRSLLHQEESGWDFERNSPERSRQMRFASLAGNYDTDPMPFRYFCTAIVRGQWVREAWNLCKSEGLEIDLQRRPLEHPWRRFKRTSKLYSACFHVAVAVKKLLVRSKGTHQ